MTSALAQRTPPLLLSCLLIAACSSSSSSSAKGAVSTGGSDLANRDDGTSGASARAELAVQLTELPADQVATLKDSLGLTEVDAKGGRVVVDDAVLRRLFGQFFKETFVEHGLERFDFYPEKHHPRLAYWENVIVQLPDFVRYGAHPAYQGYSAERAADRRLLAFLMYRLERNPEQLRSLFTRYRDTLFQLVPPEMYRKRGFSRYVDGLLTAYEHIAKHPDHPAVLDALDRAIQAQDAKEVDYGQFFSRTEQSIGTYKRLGLLPTALIPPRDEMEETGGVDTDVIWFSSFWLRRHREGTTEVAREILEAIRDHYRG